MKKDNMRALLLIEPGSKDGVRLGTVQRPEPGDDEVLVRVHFSSLNRMDLFVRDTTTATRNVELPLVMGLDASGRVARVGREVRGLSEGQAVAIYPLIACGRCRACMPGGLAPCVRPTFLGLHRHGTMADYVCVPARNVVPLPAGLGLKDAACLPTAYLTAWRMVVTKAQVTRDDMVLVLGSGGGVAVAALQWSKMQGARVIVTSGSAMKAELSRRAGADDVVLYKDEDVVRRVRDLSAGEGATVIINSVGGRTWEDSFRMAAPGARIVMSGVNAGSTAPTDLRRLFMHEYRIYGSTLGTLAEFRKVLDIVSTGKLTPVMSSVYPLEHVLRGMDDLEAGASFGKVVIDLDGTGTAC